MERHEVVLTQEHRDLKGGYHPLVVLCRKVQHDEEMLPVVLHLGELPSGGAVLQVQGMKLVVTPKSCDVGRSGVRDVHPSYVPVGERGGRHEANGGARV